MSARGIFGKDTYVASEQCVFKLWNETSTCQQ